MNYTNEAKCAIEPACAAESLGDMMKNTSAIASDVLAVTRRIHGYMFGGENECCEKSDMPRCFREELAKTRYELMATMEALAKLSSMLGL